MIAYSNALWWQNEREHSIEATDDERKAMKWERKVNYQSIVTIKEERQ
jgi:hypothetical protein